jgi:hypothetical protein
MFEEAQSAPGSLDTFLFSRIVVRDRMFTVPNQLLFRRVDPSLLMLHVVKSHHIVADPASG